MLTYSKSQVQKILKQSEKKESENEITFWYGGWSLLELRKMKPELFCDQSWYDDEPFAEKKHPEGEYTVRFKIPGSNNKTYDGQEKMLQKGECMCPIAIMATAALIYFLENKKDPWDGDWCRCSDRTVGGSRAVLGWRDGRLRLNSRFEGLDRDFIWSGGASRTSETRNLNP